MKWNGFLLKWAYLINVLAGTVRIFFKCYIYSNSNDQLVKLSFHCYHMNDDVHLTGIEHTPCNPESTSPSSGFLLLDDKRLRTVWEKRKSRSVEHIFHFVDANYRAREKEELQFKATYKFKWDGLHTELNGGGDHTLGRLWLSIAASLSF